jgi:alkylhydroperoxidase family enzyme
MTQRMQPMNPEGNEQLTATYRRIAETRGQVANILMSLSNAPAGLEAFARYGEYVRYGTELPPRVRELCVLTIAAGNEYAWRHHHPVAVKAGLIQDELDSIRSGAVLACTISAPEQAAIHYAREFARGGHVTDVAFADVKRHFTDRQITDITLLCGYFLALGATINAFRVELEPGYAAQGRSA